MSDIQKYTPLRTIVSYFMSQYDKTIWDEDKCWLLGLRALVDMHFDISAEPKTVRIPINSNKTVTIPTDYITWTKIGILNAQGEVSTLKINNALTTWRDTSNNRLSQLTPDINDSIGDLLIAPLFFNYYYNYGYYNLYGVGGGLIQYGGCRVDETNMVIVLDEDFMYDSIIFEYVSSPEKDGDYKVQTVLQEAIIAFIEWKMKLNSEENYYARVTSARRRLPGKKVTLQEINQVLRESNGFKLRS